MLKLKYQFLLLFILSLFFVPFIADGLIITEVQIQGEVPQECYIKIYNPLSEVVDISGYRLRKKTSSGRDYSLRVFPSDSYIQGRDYFIWASSKKETFPEKVNADVFSKQSISNDNSVALFDKKDNLVDAVGWGQGEDSYSQGEVLDNPEKEQIIKRKKEGGVYSQTNVNSQDFYLYPPPLSPSDIKDFETKQEKTNDKNPFVFGFFISLLLTVIIFWIWKLK
jgi:hypothetical protein